MSLETKQPNVSAVELDALHFGIDISLVDYNLRLSHQERIQQHEGALALVQELVAAREALHPEP
jgi:hypothetical protein